MSLHLQIAVSGGLYLLEASHIAEIRAQSDSEIVIGGARVPIIDLRILFDGHAPDPGCCIVVRSEDDGIAGLIADRADTLIEMSDSEFQPLPPIGPLGALVDAVSVRAAGPDTSAGTPALRLRAERLPGWFAKHHETAA